MVIRALPRRSVHIAAYRVISARVFRIAALCIAVIPDSRRLSSASDVREALLGEPYLLFGGSSGDRPNKLL